MDVAGIREALPEIESDSEALAVLQALGLSPHPTTKNSTTPEEATAAFRKVAVREFVKWIAGSRRYESISAVERDRVTAVFAEVRGAMPSVRALVDDLSLPEGRAIAMLGRMRYGEANRFEAMRYATLTALVNKGLKVPRPTVSVAEPVVFAAANSRELFDALSLMELDPAAERITDDVNPKRMAQHGYEWTMKSDDWDKFVRWLTKRGERAHEKASSVTA